MNVREKNNVSTEGIMQASTYNIADFGATGDNETLNTEAFSNAISSAFDNGGGVVYVTSLRGEMAVYSSAARLRAILRVLHWTKSA